MPEPREIELKLDIDPSDLADLKGRVLHKLGSVGQTRRLVSVYYDTPDHALRDHGISLRVRTLGDRRVQTVKRAAALSAGFFDRSEWETELSGDALDAGAIAQTPVRKVIAKARAEPVPVFESVIDRTVWQVDTERSRIEIALDVGRVLAQGRAEALAELELELKRGPASDLFDLLGELNEVAALRIGVLTKSERGYRLLAGHKLGPAKAARVELDPGMSTAAAFQAVVHECLRQFRLNEPLLVDGRVPEALHQARVALRRLRSALSLFGPVVADARLDRLKERLRSVSRELGEARNLDVYLLRAQRAAAGADEQAPGSGPVMAEVETRRVAAYDRLVATLRSPFFCRLTLDLLIWTEAGPWITRDDPLHRSVRDLPLPVFAARTLEARRRSVVRKGRDLHELDPDARHRVRIAAKKLRYAAEFFASLATRRKDRRRHTAFIEVMEELQQHLGDLNDIQTGHDLVVGLVGHPAEGHVETPAVASAPDGEVDADLRALLRKTEHALRDLKGAKRFWTRWTRDRCDR